MTIVLETSVYSRPAVTEVSVEVDQQFMQQQSWVSVYCVVSYTALRRMSTHHNLRNSLHLFPYWIQTHQTHSVTAINAHETIATVMLQQLDAG